MFQPLEQYIINYNSLLFFHNYFDFVLLNKYIFVFLIIFLSIFYIITFIKYNIFQKYLKLVIFLINEFLNVSNFNFSFIFLLYLTTFNSILLFNLLGLLPFVPCWTTQFFANFTISFTLIIGLTLMNLDKNGMDFLSLFVPKGVPALLIRPLFMLELLSYFIRIFSLSIRLFSNMVAGHSLLHILFDMTCNIASFIEQYIVTLWVVGLFMLLIVVLIFFFEIVVAFLQAYVFSIMFIIYSNDLLLDH